MARPLAKKTLLTYQLLWTLPLASAAEIVAMAPDKLGLTAPGVHAALKAGEKRGIVASVALGRELRTAKRWLYLEQGIAWGESQGWKREWWHSASGTRELARMINVVEWVYKIAPILPKSNLLQSPLVYTLHSYDWVNPEAGVMATRWTPEKSDWRGAHVIAFEWLDEGPFVAVVGYTEPEEPGNYGTSEDPNVLYLPILRIGRFQKPRDIARLRSRLGEVLVEREDWIRVPLGPVGRRREFPGAMAICTDGAAAAMAHRHYLETHTSVEDHVALGIIDSQGKVTRAMNLPSCKWTDIKVASRPRAVGNIGRTVAQLKRGAYASVNGKRRWQIFRTVATNPGVESKTIGKICGIEKAEVRKLLRPMVRSKLLFSWRWGYYPLDEGMRLYGDAEGTTFKAVDNKMGRFARIDSGHRRRNRRHDHGLYEVVGSLVAQGKTAFVVQGMCIDYRVRGKLYRARPDALIFVAGVVVALEYEISAEGTEKLGQKLEKYGGLAKIKHPIPVLFVTRTESNALLVARSGLAHAAATTLERLQKTPLGSENLGEAGCWYYWYKGDPGPVDDAPIDAVVLHGGYAFDSWRIGVTRAFGDHTCGVRPGEFIAQNQI